MNDITNQQLQHEIAVRKRAEQVSRTLLAISNAVNTARDLPDLYPMIHHILGEIFNLSNFFIAIYSPESERISFPYFVDQYDAADTYADQFSLENSLTGNTIRDRKPVLLRKEELIRRGGDGRVIGTVPELWIGIPLFIRGNVIGVMSTQSYDDAHNFDEKDLDVMIAASEQVALAIERKRNEQALMAGEERFRLAMESTDDGLWDWDLEADRVYYSPGYFTMLGYPSDMQASGTDFWRDHIHPDDMNLTQRVNEECIEGKRENFEIRFRMRTRDRKTKWLLGRGMAVSRGSDGRAIRLIGTHTDITSQVRMEEKLRSSEAKYRSMMESMIDPVYICSSDLIIQYMNPAMQKRLGRDATGESCFRALHGEDQKCSWCQFDTDKLEPYEMDVLSPLDHHSYHVSSSPIRQANGSIAKLTVFRDTTEMKQIEARLQQAQKMESIGNLAGGIAHDFNNILTPVIGMSEILMLELGKGSVHYENAREIFKAGSRGSDLVKQILAFSRQGDQQNMPIRLQPVVKEALKLCRSSIPTSIEIKESIQNNTGLVEANGTQIHQVAMNLITNAFHAVEENSGMIEVELKQVYFENEFPDASMLSDGEYIKFTVRDTGHGMSRELVDRIFDPYFTTKPKGKGTGLGLSTVYGIVRSFGGEIRVDSTLGKGTTFDVYLPRLAAGEVEGESKVITGYEGGAERILVVDDEEPIVNLLKRILQRLGYQVTGRVSSVEALNAFRSNPDKFDLVISDMTMPGMTGDILAQRLLTIRPDLPIIICTGFSERLNHENARALGIRGFLMKPIVIKDISAMVRKVLETST